MRTIVLCSYRELMQVLNQRPRGVIKGGILVTTDNNQLVVRSVDADMKSWLLSMGVRFAVVAGNPIN